MKPILLGGPSGSGKSHLCRVLQKRNWLYLEADQHPKDGIDELNLRTQWESFLTRSNSELLSSELLKRRDNESKEGVILSLPSGAVPSPVHVSNSKKELSILFLFGHPKYCLKAFLDREKRSGRNYDSDHWNRNNNQVYATLSTSDYHGLLIDVFHENGERIDIEKLVEQVVPHNSGQRSAPTSA